MKTRYKVFSPCTLTECEKIRQNPTPHGVPARGSDGSKQKTGALTADFEDTAVIQRPPRFRLGRPPPLHDVRICGAEVIRVEIPNPADTEIRRQGAGVLPVDPSHQSQQLPGARARRRHRRLGSHG